MRNVKGIVGIWAGIGLFATGCYAGIDEERSVDWRGGFEVADLVGTDRFGVGTVYETAGRTWYARWDEHPRTLHAGQTDPRDSQFHNLGRDNTFKIHGNGTATAQGQVMRHYIWDRSGNKKWRNVEMTFYGKRIEDFPDATKAGLTVEVRTGNGHTSDPARQCQGAAYAATMRNWGGARLGKELKHPIYASKGGPDGVSLWEEMPHDQWIGFKMVAADQCDGSVRLELYRDLTDGKNGGKWERVLDFVDAGGWQTDDGAPLCGYPADRIITGAHPVVLFRNDKAKVQYKKASVREIHPDPEARFVDTYCNIFEDAIEWIADRGITKGCNPPDNDRYCPDDDVTRSQMATFIVRALDLPAADADYFDDDDGSVHENAINALAAAGITSGCGDRKFCGDEPLTRGAMAAFVKRGWKLPAATTDYFKDDDGSVFESSINALAEAGITKGCNPPDNDRFCLDETLTRGQMAAVLRRAMTL